MEEEKKEIPSETKMPESMLPQDIYELIRFFILTLAGQAWTYLGLMPNPKDNAIAKDLIQAKLGIDCINLLYKRLEEHLIDNEKNEFKELINNLELNFIQQQS
ncbi:MAG: DUF1844 domain-containing protein [Armatimonadetes bacterium]|nr:DUF1844 domain-containing protein [Armatimonadota bacterium]